METKLSRLLGHMEREEWRDALKLAASFARLGDHKVAIQRGWEALARPELYRQMGKDPDALVAAGIEALRERYL